MPHSSRSRSRGRELYSTGRGGAGNIHRSLSRDGSVPGPATDPAPHGRESTPSGEPVTHVGRGGAGNFRDPLRPREEGITPAQASYEHDVIERHDESPHFYSTGRGGAGNIKTPTPEHSHSRSRSRGGPSSALDHPAQAPGMERSLSRGRVLHSTGRGGAGNITADTLHEEDADELERRAHSPSRAGELHSTGRGGLANVTALSSPPIEVSPSRFGGDGSGDGDGDGGIGTGMVSTGRGGAGNIAPASRDRTRSASRGGAPRSGSRGGGERDGQAARQHHHGAIGKIMERVKARHHEHHEHSEHGEEYYEREGHEVPEAGMESPPAALK